MKKNNTKKVSRTLKVFETFAGIGAQHKALEYLKVKDNYNYKVVATSEWDIYANIAYSAIHNNINKSKGKEIRSREREREREREIAFLEQFDHSKDGKTPIKSNLLHNLDDETLSKLYKSYIHSNNLGSITKITGKNLINKIEGNEVDLITYSFPCQDLSVAGSFWGFNQGMEKSLNNRSGLLWEIDRILDELNEIEKLPKFLLLENVKNMLSKRHIEQYHIWLKKLKKLNYSTRTFKLNAKNYGLPQNRERVYALSILNYDGKVDKDTGEILDIDDPKKITDDKTLRQLIKDDYKIEKYKEEALQSQPNRTPSREKMFTLNRKLNDFDNCEYSRTLTTKQDRHPNAGVINLSKSSIGGKHRAKGKANYRLITTREAYLLMGFSEEDYENVIRSYDMKKAKLYHQAGNSIAVDVMIPLMKLIHELNNKGDNNG